MLYLDMRSCGNISWFWKERPNVVQKSLKTPHPKDTKGGMILSRGTWSLLTLPFCLLTIWTCFWHKSKDTMLLVGCKPNQICLTTLSRHKSLQHHILRLAGTLHVVICCFSGVIYDCHFEISLTSRLLVPKTLMSKSLSSQSLFRDCCTRGAKGRPKMNLGSYDFHMLTSPPSHNWENGKNIQVHSLLKNKKKLFISTVIHILVGLPFGIGNNISEVLYRL
jgi:hypothetical protein